MQKSFSAKKTVEFFFILFNNITFTIPKKMQTFDLSGNESE